MPQKKQSVLYLDYNIEHGNNTRNTRCTNDYNNSDKNKAKDNDQNNNNNINRNDFDCQFSNKINGLERRLCNIESMLWDNREKYTKSLDIVANRELDINNIVTETRKVLAENRQLYSDAFKALFEKEEKLEQMLQDLRRLWQTQKYETKTQINETQKILTENRKIYTEAFMELRDAEVRNSKSLERIQENTPIFLGPVSALNPLLSHINRTGSGPSSGPSSGPGTS